MDGGKEMALLEVKNLHTYFKTRKGIVKAVNDGRIELSQIEDSVTRILMTKINYGLIEKE